MKTVKIMETNIISELTTFIEHARLELKAFRSRRFRIKRKDPYGYTLDGKRGSSMRELQCIYSISRSMVSVYIQELQKIL